MEATSNVQGSKAVVELQGKLTVQSVDVLEETLSSIPEEACDFDIDMSQVDYVSSAGLRLLMSASKTAIRRGGVLRVLYPQDDVMDVFDITGIAGVVTVVR